MNRICLAIILLASQSCLSSEPIDGVFSRTIDGGVEIVVLDGETSALLKLRHYDQVDAETYATCSVRLFLHQKPVEAIVFTQIGQDVTKTSVPVEQGSKLVISDRGNTKIHAKEFSRFSHTANNAYDRTDDELPKLCRGLPNSTPNRDKAMDMK